VKVTLSVGSQAFQKQLAIALANHGMLARMLSLGPHPEILEPDESGDLRLIRRYPHFRLANRVLWAAWRRLPFTERSERFPIVLTTRYLDWLLSRELPECDVFHGWSSVCFAGLRMAKRRGAVTMIENPTMHPRDWQSAVLRECDTWGVRPQKCRSMLPEALIRRMEEEFAIADFIVVPSAIAANSFRRAGIMGKALVVHAAVDNDFFKPLNSGREDRTFRVCYAGRVELAKGVIYLLQAWKKLALKDAELVMVGDVAEEMAGLIREYGSPSVRFEGLLTAEKLVRIYRNADLFAFPSVNEGLARVLLEAMATGLPVVASDCSGADDCVTPGVDGTVIPARDVEAMAKALMWHYENREATKAMGTAARMKIETHFTMAHYEQKMMQTYRSVAEAR
jgi:glycosyltransferase involved in cell wall biosynthesis